METELKGIDGLIIKISIAPDGIEKGSYFYSTFDNKIHKVLSCIPYFYCDEKYRGHPREQAYKIHEISDNQQYPEIPLLKVLTLEELGKKLIDIQQQFD